MDLVRHLSYFTTIASEEHFGRAAQRLGMRQPPLSQGLRRLEDDLGVRLFDRNSRTVRLTDAGRALLPAALRVIDEVEQLRLLAKRHTGLDRPAVRVRVAPGLGGTHFSSVVAACHRVLLDADLDIAEQPTSAQIADLLADRADVGVLREPVASRDVTLGDVVSAVLRCMLPADHPAAHAGEVSLREVAGLDLVVRPRDEAPAAHDELISMCERHGFLPGTIHQTADERVARGLVASGRAVAFTTDPPTTDTDVCVVPISSTPIELRFRLGWRGDLPPAVHPVTDALAAALTSESSPVVAVAAARPRAVSELPALAS